MDIRQAGKVIRDARERLSVTQEEVANYAEIARPTLAVLELGKVKGDMGYVKIWRVMQAVGIELPDIAEVGRIIREQRDIQDISQDKLSKDTNVGRSSVSQLENNNLPGDIGFDRVCRVLSSLGVELEYQHKDAKVSSSQRKIKRRREAEVGMTM